MNTCRDAFDGNLQTFFASWERSYTWAGLDLGVPHVITRVGWSPRNDVHGEQRVQLGVFEGANSPDFMDALAEFHISAQAAYTIAKGHEIQAEVFNTNNDKADRIYAGAEIKRSRHPLGINLNWTGNMFDGRLQTLWACNYMSEAKGANTKILMLVRN